jgi:hypothetical protein
VHPRQVVVLHEVLADQLVVGCYLIAPPPLGAPLFESVAGQPVRQVAELAGQRGGPGVKVDEHQEPPRLGTHREQPVVGFVETFDRGQVEHALLVGRDV